MRPEAEPWVAVAETDVRAARRLAAPPDPIPEGVCYHVQQVIEKYLKAALEDAGRIPPRTHDLGQLLVLSADVLPVLVPHWTDIEAISAYATMFRYPNHDPETEDVDDLAERAIATMETVRRLIRLSLTAPNDDPAPST